MLTNSQQQSKHLTCVSFILKHNLLLGELALRQWLSWVGAQGLEA